MNMNRAITEITYRFLCENKFLFLPAMRLLSQMISAYVYKKLWSHFPQWLLNFIFTEAKHESSSYSSPLLVLNNVSISFQSGPKSSCILLYF